MYFSTPFVLVLIGNVAYASPFMGQHLQSRDIGFTCELTSRVSQVLLPFSHNESFFIAEFAKSHLPFSPSVSQPAIVHMLHSAPLQVSPQVAQQQTNAALALHAPHQRARAESAKPLEAAAHRK